MTAIVTWNIQCARGLDGKVDPARIASVARQAGAADIFCFQEVARHMPDLDGGAGGDQVDAFRQLFPGYEAVFGAALDYAGVGQGPRRAFGNLVLSRLPVLQAFRHPLPQPADGTVKHMPRQATEIVVEDAAGPLRVLTTHLEYHSEPQRMAQAERLRALHEEAAANQRTPAVAAAGPYAAPPRPARAVLCGDLNLLPGDPVYRLLVSPFAGETPPLVDAWRALHGSPPHPPTCGIFDREQWPQGPHCRDYFLVTPDIAGRAETLEVDRQTDASDHQPLRLVLSA